MVGPMAEISMIQGCDREHPEKVEGDCGNDGSPTPTSPNNPDATEVQEYEWNRSAELKFFWHVADFLSPFGEVVRVD
jgi:hypothetical protein